MSSRFKTRQAMLIANEMRPSKFIFKENCFLPQNPLVIRLTHGPVVPFERF